MSGKIKTVLQMAAVIIIIVGLSFPTQAWILLGGLIVYIASLIMTVYSGVEYVSQNLDVFSM